MKKSYIYLLLLTGILTFNLNGFSSIPVPTCDFAVATTACTMQEVGVEYTGNAPANATYLWNFDGAIIISGSGQGPYWIKWETAGEKHITLSIEWEGQSCTKTKPVVVSEQPRIFEMTGGGVYIPGGPAIAVGLSGSQTDIIYKLFRNEEYAGISMVGTGQQLVFGEFTETGIYTSKGRVDGSDCSVMMAGQAVITTPEPLSAPSICVVTFDTILNHNVVIWKNMEASDLSHFNIYKETHQNNEYDKIGEVLIGNPGYYSFSDVSSNPLVKSDKYKLSATDTLGNESEPSAFHKTIHLNINPGIYGFNLIWNHYEGYAFATYRIYRQYGAASWELIDSVASNVDSYTDVYTTSGLATYYIEAVRNEPCGGEEKNNFNENTQSNWVTSAPLGEEEMTNEGIRIYPNPVTNRLFIKLNNNSSITGIEIIHPSTGIVLITGKLDLSGTDVSPLMPGLYILRILTEDQVLHARFIRGQ